MTSNTLQWLSLPLTHYATLLRAAAADGKTPPAATEARISLARFERVQNTKELRELALANELQLLLLRPAFLFDVNLLQNAASKAHNDNQGNCMTCKNVLTEILVNLSTTRNVRRKKYNFLLFF